MIKTFAATRIVQLRRRASKVDQVPDDVPPGWSKSTVDPMAVLAVFKPLTVKDGYVLRAYQFREGGNGNGFVWAMPVESEFPDPERWPRLVNAFLEPPRPPAALDNYMDAIDGDGSPWSYMCASVLARELAEFGAMWHGCDWDTHRILEADPWGDNVAGAEEGTIGPLESVEQRIWLLPKPNNWKPQVSQENDRIAVRFFTLSGLGGETVYRHTDVYTLGSYKFKFDGVELARGPGGFVF